MNRPETPSARISRHDRLQLAVRLGQSLRQVEGRIRQGSISVVTLPSGLKRVLMQNRGER